jgi:phenylacetate-CoA ligase
MSPGPIFDPEGRGRLVALCAALYAAGVRAGGLLQNCFSYHFTPAAFMVEGGAARIGCAVIPAGSGQTDRCRPSTTCGRTPMSARRPS